MALSMDEQRMLAEIERRLAAQDPGLATRLSSFKRPGPAAWLRTTRGKIIGSICTIALPWRESVCAVASSSPRPRARRCENTLFASRFARFCGEEMIAISQSKPRVVLAHVNDFDAIRRPCQAMEILARLIVSGEIEIVPRFMARHGLGRWNGLSQRKANQERGEQQEPG